MGVRSSGLESALRNLNEQLVITSFTKSISSLNTCLASLSVSSCAQNSNFINWRILTLSHSKAVKLCFNLGNHELQPGGAVRDSFLRLAISILYTLCFNHN